MGLLSVPPDLQATDGKQFPWDMAWKLQGIQARADTKIPPNGPHLLTPPFFFAVEECKFCHSWVSVKV